LPRKFKVWLTELSNFHRIAAFSCLGRGELVRLTCSKSEPGLKRAAVEIKSSTTIVQSDLRSLLSLGKDIPNCELFCFSLDEVPKRIEGVHCLYWREGLKEVGL
jgi:hypothetical protein